MFLSKAELKTVKAPEVIDLITQSDDTTVSDLIADNIDRVKNYLRNFYDIDAIFNAVDADRSRTVLRWVKHLVIADLFAIRSHELPPVIEKMHDETMRALEQANAGKLNLDLPKIQEDTDGDGVPDSDKTILLNGGRKNYANHW